MRINLFYQEALGRIYNFPRFENLLLAMGRGPMEAIGPLKEFICM